MALTEKQKNFCREYFSNGGNGTQAYLTAYDGTSEVAAANESSLLLKRDDIRDYLNALNKPLEEQAISEREKKRSMLWEGIERCIAKEDEAGAARYFDILNRLDGEYININRNIEDKPTEIINLDTNTLKKLSGAI